MHELALAIAVSIQLVNMIRVSLAAIFFILAIHQDKVFAQPHLRIINGTAAKDGEFPYMVQVRNKAGYFLCGGSIIASTWILTAGHCLNEYTYGTIIYGTNKIYDYNDETPATSVKVKKTYVHPNFGYNFTEIGPIPLYDIGVIELEEPIPFDNKARPVKIAAASDSVPVHVEAVLSGWGVSSSKPTPESYLQKIILQLLTDSECKEKIDAYAVSSVFNCTHNICSNDMWNGGCSGDSGGPLVINGTQFGILSWNIKPCGVVPNTYSRITNPEYRNFIKNITGI